MAKQPSGKGKKSLAKNKVSPPVDYSKPIENAKYEVFCQAYMVTSNATQAAKDAAYSEKTAKQKGSQLLTIVDIKNRIAVLRGELADETGVSAKMVIEGFRKIATGILSKTLSNKHKLRALENLAKYLGMYGKDNEQRQGMTIADIMALAEAVNVDR